MAYLDTLQQSQRHVATLRMALGAVVVVAVAGMWFSRQIPAHLDVHIAPNLRPGEVVSVRGGSAPVPLANVYGFGFYIWQQLNRWSKDGAVDYPGQIATLQAFLTPSCHAQLMADVKDRASAGELSLRTRTVQEAPGAMFAEWRVAPQAETAWSVVVDTEVAESLQGTSVKSTLVRYPLRVVRFDVDREKNPWQLALDCFGDGRPARLTPADVGRQAPAAKANSGIDPAALPQAVKDSK